MNTDFEAIEIYAIQSALMSQLEELEELLNEKLSVFERESYSNALDATQSALKKINYMIEQAES